MKLRVSDCHTVALGFTCNFPGLLGKKYSTDSIDKFPDRLYMSAIAGKAWKNQGAHGGDSVVHSGGLVVTEPKR